MPELCRFLGIVIYLLYDDHQPAHFHAEYGGYQISVEIASGIVEDRFPRRALSAVLEWYSLHKEELLEDWRLAEQHRPLNGIPPLEQLTLLSVKSAKHADGYKIWVEFSDGESGVADLEPDLWGPAFEPLRDPEKFRQFEVSDVLHTLVWANGADLAPASRRYGFTPAR
jgi:hypothetical protein